MNSVFLKKEKGYNHLIKKILILLIPFLLYGVYKNGYILYKNDIYKLYEVFMPLYYCIISILISFVFSKIYKEDFFTNRLYSNILISLITFSRTNLLIYIILLILLNYIFRKIKINIVPLYIIILSLIYFLMKKYTFLNPIEQNITHNYLFTDYLIGKGYGGVSNTLLIMNLISLFILMFDMEYKQIIPFSAFISYYILLIIYAFIIRTLNIDLFLNNNLIFSVIFISTISIYSSYTKGAQYLSGILIGVLSFISVFIDINIGVYLSILVVSCLKNVLDNIFSCKKTK